MGFQPKLCDHCGQVLPAVLGIKFNPGTGIVGRENYTAEVKLSITQATLFAVFLAAPQLMVARETVLQALYGAKPLADWPRTRIAPDVKIHYMRKRLRPIRLSFMGHYGFGWQLVDIAVTRS